MADPFWPDAKASIVLLPSGEQGKSLLSLAGEWTKMGLLGPALWVLPERVDELHDGPPRIDAVVIGIGRDQEIAEVRLDLFEALAQEALSVVRLVKLRSALPERELDALQDGIADRVREYVRKSMPMPNPAANITEQATELKHATLICAPTEFQLRQRVDWASGEFGVVVVASPEDRSSPWSGDAFVRENDRFVGFTLMHLASVAGLWNGVGRGSFELYRREESGHQSVWISRVFVNAVLTESLGRRTAAQVLSEAARPDSLLVDASVSAPPEGTAFIDDVHVSGYVDDMVAGALRLDDGTLGFRKPQESGAPGKRRVGFWAQLGRFLAFAGDKLARMPYWAWRWISSAASRRLTRSLHTDEGAELVGSQIDDAFDVRDQILLAEARRIKDSEQAARAQVNAPAGVAHLRTTPRLWMRLRELVFGSLDGSADLSELGFAPIEGSVPVFGRVSDVLALPTDPWRASREEVPEGFPSEVDWYALALDDPREQLEHHLREATRRRIESTSAIAVLTSEIAALGARPAQAEGAAEKAPSVPVVPATRRDAASLRASADGDAATQPDPSEAPPAAPVMVTPAPSEPLRLVAAREELAAARAELQRAETEERTRTETLERYDGWASTQDRSFIWRLLTRLAGERRNSEKMAMSYAEEIERTVVPAPGDLMRLRQRFHRTMLVGWIVAAVLAVIAWLVMVQVGAKEGEDAANTFDADSWYQWTWIALAVIAAAVVLLTVIALIRYHSGWSRFQRRIDVTQARLAQIGHHSRLARQEATRLRSLHRQTVDWLVLLSKAIHKPWHVPHSWLEKQSYEVARGALPFAVQVSTIQDDDRAATARLRGVMTDQLVVRGWRHAAFESLVAEIALERGSSPSTFGLEALDEDLPHSSNHTRKMLLASLDDDTVLTRVAGPRLEELVKSAQRNELHGGRPHVRPVGSNPLHALVKAGDPFASASADIPWDDFLLGSLAGRRDPITPLSATVLAELELSERHHERVTSYLVLPRRLESRLAFHDAANVSIITFEEGGTAPVDLVWRVDIAGPVPLSAIHLWNDPVEEVPSVTRPPSAARGDDTGV